MKDLEATTKILGMEMHRDRKAGKLYLSQKSYLLKVLERFGMSSVKSEKVSLASHFKISAELCPQTEDKHELCHAFPTPVPLVASCML